MSTAITKRVRLRSGIALTTALALSAGASVVGAAAASAAPAQAPIDTSGFDSGRYIVVLDEDPMATYRGHLPNLARTAPLGTDDIDVDSAAANAYAAAYVELRRSAVVEQSEAAFRALTDAIRELDARLVGAARALVPQRVRERLDGGVRHVREQRPLAGPSLFGGVWRNSVRGTSTRSGVS